MPEGFLRAAVARRRDPLGIAADAIGVVCNALGDNLARVAGLPRERIVTLYNPVVSPAIAEQASAPLDHPWFAPGAPPVLLGAGRLVDQNRASRRNSPRPRCPSSLLGDSCCT